MNPRIFVAFLLCFLGAMLALMSAGLESPPRGPAEIPASSTSASAAQLRRYDPLLSVRRVLANYGILPGSQRDFAKRGSGPGGGAPAPALTPFVSDGVDAIVSPALRDLPPSNSFSAYISRGEERRPANRGPQLPRNPLEQDSVAQITAPNAMPPVGASFEGINIEQACGSCLPPDTVGAVGPNHFVQMVNSHIAVYSRTGATIVAPKAINTLWSTAPNSICATHNNGDPIVLYDQLADRWLVSQFTIKVATENYAECIAISKTPDPSGEYWLYQFEQSADVFHDYPHIGLWPDGYYMSTNLFPDNGDPVVAGAWAFEREKMLLGQTARYVFFDLTSQITELYTPFGQLPSSLDGKTLPPPGSPNYFVETTDANEPNTPPAVGLHDIMRIWKFHVDWNNPANSTFGLGSSAPALKPGFPGQYAGMGGAPDFVFPIADYILNACLIENGPNDCVPQNVTAGNPPQYLDVLGDRLMFRLAYRNFGTHESLVVNHTADVLDTQGGAARTGVRWYEIRSPGNSPVVHQQGTFAPFDPANPLWRWMGSAAMDQSGNLAIGYSASGPAYFPSIHYAGRLSTDPLNQLSQGEGVMFLGQGIEANTGIFPFRNRWGDYSSLVIDPVDDCTFWYTTEYMVSTLTDILPVDWHTRIGSFKFPNCGPTTTGSPTPTPTPTATPTPGSTPTASPAATASPTATASPVATATPTATPSATPEPAATPTPTPTPSASPAATPAQLLNISTRLRVQTGDNVLIGGFIIRGNSSKSIVVRGLGPSISSNGNPVPGRLADPRIELRNKSGALIAENNNWKDSQRTEIETTGLAPQHDEESALTRSLPAGEYTVIMRGNDGGTGIGLIEAYDVDRSPQSTLANLSTRGFVETGDNVMIGGFISGPSNRSNLQVVVRALGPSLSAFGVPGTLQDPMLEIHNQNGATIATNDDWATDPNSATVAASGLAPSDPKESAIYMTLPTAQPHTAIVRGKDDSVGVGLVEIYNIR